MNKLFVFKSLMALIAILISSVTYSQNSSELKTYNEFESVGKTEGGIKTGHWCDISSDSIIYREGDYDEEGKPEGWWTVYYPDGKKRKETLYSDHQITSWSRYVDENKILEIKSKDGIPENIYKSIVDFEQFVFENEGKYFEKHSRSESYFGTYKYVVSLSLEPIDMLDYMQVVLRKTGFTGEAYYYRTDGKLRRSHIFNYGEEEHIAFFYKEHGSERLLHQDEYHQGKLYSITSYDKDGNVKKVEKF